MTDHAPRRRSTVLLTVALVALFALSLLLAPHPDGQEPFAGTDSLVTQLLQDAGVTAWFTPLFQPTGAVESGLFALQAALGAGVLGYALGNLQGRRARLRDVPRADSAPEAE